MKALGWPLLVSWALHAGVIALVWLSLSGDSGFRGGVLELIGPSAAGRSVPAASNREPPALARPRASAPAGGAPHAAVTPAPAPPAPSTAAPSPIPEDAGSTADSAVPAPPFDGSLPSVGAAAPRGGALTPPRPIDAISPRYPESARHSGAQGTTLLKVRVRADGFVGDVLVERSSGHPQLDGAAVDAVSRTRFEPARRGAEPLELWILLPVTFTIG